MKKFERIGLVGRFRPLHKGAASVLLSLCEQAELVIIGIGSSNKYNVRNPFTPQEAEGMIRAFFDGKEGNFEFRHIPDFAHMSEYRNGEKWKKTVLRELGELDGFVTGNPYVKKLLGTHYKIYDAFDIVPEDKRVTVRGTVVRQRMADFDDWQSLLPSETINYLEKNDLVERFRRTFADETLMNSKDEDDITERESLEDEKKHARES